MNIVRLQAENVKRLKAITITPDGNVVVIGGRNAQGKTSVLDSIYMALGGKGAQPIRPVRDGAKKATIKCDLGELLVKRTITPTGGGTLTVEAKDGKRYSSPQAVLDALTGQLSFDPLEFSRMDNAAQQKTLMELVGLNFADVDIQRQNLYDERAGINRESKRVETRLNDTPPVEDAPKHEVDVAGLMAELEKRQKTNVENATVRDSLDDLLGDMGDAEADEARLEKELADLRVNRASLASRIEERREFVKSLANADEGGVKAEIAGAESINQRWRQGEARKQLSAESESLCRESSEKTNAMDEIDAGKAQKIADATFPIPGLGFGETGVTYSGIPFGQCSSSEQLRISVAMGLAMNPKFRVVLIRDGSLLDEDSLAVIAEMAQEADAQVWIERVSDGNEVSVIIEDGAIVEKK